MEALRDVNVMVVLAVIMMQVMVSTVYYFSTFRAVYLRHVDTTRRPAFTTAGLPAHPFRALAGTVASFVVLTMLLNHLAIMLHINSWEQGLLAAAVLWLADTCLHIRHYLFEGRPLALFILHSGYHGVILAMSCALLCAFGGPQEGRSGAGAGAGRVARSEL